ncbi:FHA domain-containing protein [uncultured Roseobacter sp.]|uniref:FHA domain-containing protein n=1 Tax=uncultured Roseobacter sp. TaxID=114847 RepID=UPI0026380A58|nr:FHA domain-containing protein [uncultured Roseobacter sp.]
MTLFRKVFQNQSTPATSEEGLDDDALREAFMKTAEERVLPLDPFAVPDSDAEISTDSDAPSMDGLEDRAGADAALGTEGASGEANEDPEDDSEADIAAVLAQTRDVEHAQPTTGVDMAPDVEPKRETNDDAPQVAFADEPAEDMVGGPDEAGDTPSDVVEFAKRQLELSRKPNPPAESDATPIDLSTVGGDGGVPASSAGRSGRRAGRVKTRLLGFNRPDQGAQDPIGATGGATAKPQDEKFPVGWLVVVEGPGVGHSFSIFTGASMIGRGDDQVIKLDFGDNSISRHNHAAIAYDEEQNKFYIGHGGKSNIIRRNARPVLSTEELHHADLIRIGETTLRFVALCGSDFKWDMTDVSDAGDV